MTVLNPSKAHQRSAFAVEDPAYSIFQQKPPRRMEKSWLYPRAEYECFLLCQMRKAVERLKLNVGYPGEFHRPVSRVLFRRELAAGVHPIRVNGSLSVIPNGEEIVIEPTGLFSRPPEHGRDSDIASGGQFDGKHASVHPAGRALRVDGFHGRGTI